MENLLLLGVPILKHITVFLLDQFNNSHLKIVIQLNMDYNSLSHIPFKEHSSCTVTFMTANYDRKQNIGI